MAVPDPNPVMVEGRIPPHDIDAEAATLSAIMVDSAAFDQVGDLLRPEHFYSEAHRRIYEAEVAVVERGGVPDIIQVATWLRDHDRLAQVGGVAYLTETLNAAPAVANIRHYAEIVRGKWIAREVLLASQHTTALGYTSYGTPEEYLNGASEALYKIASGQAPTTTQNIRDVLIGSVQKVRDAAARGSGITGISSGFDRYDRLTAGLHGGELTVLAARPGMGKTSLAGNIAENVASVQVDGVYTQAVAFLSVEMPREHVVNRWVCSNGRIDSGRFRTGLLTPADWTKIMEAMARLAALPVWIDDQSAMTLMDARAKVRRIGSEALKVGAKIALVIVDYLQLMRSVHPTYNREQEVADISRGLKQLAKDLNVPVIALASLNRETEKRGDKGKRPQLSDLRDSGAVESDADNVCFIYRDDYYNKDSEDRNIAELILAKQRNGATDTVRVRFDAQYTRFDNLSDGEYDRSEEKYP